RSGRSAILSPAFSSASVFCSRSSNEKKERFTIYWSAPMSSSRKTLSFPAKGPGIGRFLPFILILLVSSSSLLSAAEPAERIAAVVNGEIIFLSDLERYRLFFEPLEKKTETPADPMKTLEAIVNRRLLLK